MRVYLDNCCYNRPFDDQTQTKVRMETEAKLLIQSMMRTGVVEYVWSFMLRLESSRNLDPQRKYAIAAWANGAVVDVAPTNEVRAMAHEFEKYGVKPYDAIHLACAELAACDWFFTVDRGILKKIRNVGSMRVANPVDFVLEGST
ncbi:MAG: type II toxin-antitoxin system VapC family toxin [Kiritimatiellae bacterium]|nr:type II toxin-antitoxin system VapC family toxin [Kiritimatiellia bacterium]